MNKRWAYAAIAIATALWGFGFVFGKYALAEMPVGAMITFRFAIAALALLPVLFLRRIKVTRRDLLLFALAGLCYVPVQFILQFEGLNRTSLTHAALMVALLPVLVALASTIFTRNGARPQWIPIAISTLGAGLVVFHPGGHSTVLGDALVLLSFGGAIAWIILSERFNERYDPIASSTQILIIGTIGLIAIELATHPHDLIAPYSRAAWIATVLSGVLCTAITTVLWNVGLRHVAASDASIFINMEPLVGAVCGVTLFGDILNWQLVAGGVMIVAGAIAVTRRSQMKTGRASASAASKLAEAS